MAIKWISKFNIFAAVGYDSPIDPYSRVLHTNAWQKAKIVYQWVAGGETFYGGIDFLGVGLLLRFICRKISKWWDKTELEENTQLKQFGIYFAKVLLLLSGVFIALVLANFLMNVIVRHALAAAFVAATAVFIGIAQLITEKIRAKKAEEISTKLRVIPVDEHNQIIGNTPMLLATLLKKQGGNLGGIDIKKDTEKRVCFLTLGKRFIFLNKENQVVSSDDPLMLNLAQAASTNVRRAVLGENDARAISVRV